MLVVEDDVPAVPQTTFSSKKSTNSSSASASSSSSSLEVLPYSSLRDFAWWRDYQERQASASPLQDDHARAWVAAADALLSDSRIMDDLRKWGPDVVVGDTAYLATYGLAAALGDEGEEEEEEEGNEGNVMKEKPRLSPSSSPSSSSPSLSSPPPPPPRRRPRGLPFATVSCTGIVDPVHGWLMRFDNDAGSIPQFGSGLRAPMVKKKKKNFLALLLSSSFLSSRRKTKKLTAFPLSLFASSPLPLNQKKQPNQTFSDRLRNRAFKVLASLYFRAAFLRLWRPVMLRHGIPLPGSRASVPRELGHIFNASPLLEWPRSLPPHVKLVGPILMDSSKEEERRGKEEKEVVASASASASAAAASSSSSSSSSPPPSSSSAPLNGRKDERAPLPPRVAALADAAAAGLSPPLVLVSFGTTVRLSAADARAVAAALRSLAPRRVVWKLAPGDVGGGLTPESLLAEVQGKGGAGGGGAGGKEEEEENIVAVPWLPQQSLLSKRRRLSPPPSLSSPPLSSPSSSPSPPPSSSPPSSTSLPPVVAAFVTHGGMNGLYEAAAAGVPLVGVPFFGDGEDNLEKAAGRGIGVTLGRGGLRRKGEGKREGEESEERRWRWWSNRNATAAAFPSSSSSSSPSSPSPSPSPPSSNLNASDPSSGAGRLALALRRVLDDPSFAAEASKMARGLWARPLSTGRLPREEAADAVELGAWAWRQEKREAEREAERAAAAAAVSSSASSSGPASSSSVFLEKGKGGEETCAAATE